MRNLKLAFLFLLFIPCLCFADFGGPDPTQNTNPQATTKPSPNNVPKAYSSGKIDSGWLNGLGSSLGWKVPSDYSNNLQTTVNAGNTEVSTALTLSGNTTVPATSELWITDGGVITLGNYNLTINGPFHGSPGCFIQNGTGQVTFTTPPDPVLTSWFGTALTDAPIRSAVKSLPPSTGGHVLVDQDATYVATVAIPIVDRNNVILEGKSRNGTVISCNCLLALDPSVPAVGSWAHDGGNPNWGIIQVDGTSQYSTSNNITIKNLTLVMGTTNYSQNQQIIFYGQVQGFHVESCNLYGNYWDAIYGNGWSYSATGAYISSVDIHFDDNYFGSTGLSECIRLNCNALGFYAHRNYFDTIQDIGIVPSGGQNIEITHNVFWRPRNWAIEVGEGEFAVYNALVAHNRIMQLGYDAIGSPIGIKISSSNGPYTTAGPSYQTESTRGVVVSENIITDTIAGTPIQSAGSLSLLNNVVAGISGSASLSAAFWLSQGTDIDTYTGQQIVYSMGNRVEDTNSVYKWQYDFLIGNPDIGSQWNNTRLTVFSTNDYAGDLLAWGASILTNGSMASNIIGWTGANWAYNSANGGEALHTTGATTALSSSNAVSSGTQYFIAYTVQYGTTGTVTMSVGGLTDTAKSASGLYTFEGKATATTAITFTPTSTFDGSVQLVLVQPGTRNYAFSVGDNAGSGHTVYPNAYINGSIFNGYIGGQKGAMTNILNADGSLDNVLVTINNVGARTAYINVQMGGSVTSATSIIPTGDIFHVTGANKINTIIAPGLYANRQITILPDAVFTLGTSGNIAIASTAVVGKAMVLTYDGVNTDKWYPSY